VQHAGAQLDKNNHPNRDDTTSNLIIHLQRGLEMSTRYRAGKHLRQITSLAVASTFLCQNFAWAVCSDGVATVPAAVRAGFHVATTYNLGPGPWNPTGGPTLVNPNHWSPGTYTATANSMWVPDDSSCENNDCATLPVAGGGHNWTFDQGSTLCKAHYAGPGGGFPTAWANPAASPTDCIFTDVVTGEQVIVLDVNGTLVTITTPITRGITDLPYQGEVLTPTCDPTQYGPIPAGAPAGTILGPGLPTNTYFNHLGCSISHGVATEPHGATTYMWVAGIHGGMFVIPLINNTPQAGG